MKGITQQIALRMRDEYEEFIFRSISPFCDAIAETHIQKKELERIISNAKRYRWHDLRKNPEDLPDDNRLVIICPERLAGSKDGIEIAFYVKNKKLWEEEEFYYREHEVIAWREIEPFEEVE